ncbi:MAG: PA2779 family protein [Thermodesulfobacteriota bacterium]|nr:PA2779 family protein [Thermodesulfobacteriota bacterium]
MGTKLSLNGFKNPLLVFSVTVWFTAFLLFPSLATAALSGSILSSPGASLAREAELAKVRQVLENKIAAQKLKDFGLSPDEVSGKLSSMTDEQIHHLASLSDRITAGGDGVGTVIGVLFIIILVIVIIKLLDKRIIIR